jgi:glycosyltransferase involved in cell wall biosynthesis
MVVGRNPPQKLLTEVKKRNLPWHVTGFVDDIRPFVYDADACVIPLRIGSGTRIKAYEAIAMECPIVSTEIGVEGLSLIPEEHYLAADEAGDFAAAVTRLLQDVDLRNRLAGSARSFVEENCSSKVVAQRFEEICWHAMKNPMPGS